MNVIFLLIIPLIVNILFTIFLPMILQIRLNEIYYIKDTDYGYQPVSDITDAYVVVMFIIKTISYLRTSRVINKTLKNRKMLYYTILIMLMMVG